MNAVIVNSEKNAISKPGIIQMIVRHRKIENPHMPSVVMAKQSAVNTFTPTGILVARTIGVQ